MFLIGRTPIGELLGFIRNMAVDGQGIDFSGLTADGRTANDYAIRLERDEAGAADPPVRKSSPPKAE